MMSGGSPPDKPGGSGPLPSAPAPSRLPPSAPPAPPPAPVRPRTVAAKFEALLGAVRHDLGDVDGSPGGEVESTSAPQKEGGPERKLEADPDERETGKGDRNRDAPSVSADDSRVKPPPSTRGAADVSEDNSGDGGGRGGADDARGRVLPFRKWQRATLSSIATLFDTEGLDVRLDDALGTHMLYAPPPWVSKKEVQETYPRPVKKIDELRATQWITEMHAEDVSVVVVADALRLTAANPDRRVDSVRARVLEFAGVWDGVPRIDTDVATRLGLADASSLQQQAVARWLVATARRMVSPGAPLEEVLLVECATVLRQTVQAVTDLLPPELVLDTSLNFDCRFGVAARRLVGRGLVVISDATHHTPRELETLVSFAAQPSDGDDLPLRHAGFALVASGRRQEHVPARCVVTRVVRPPLATPLEVRRQWLAEALARADTYVPEVRANLYRTKEHPWAVPVLQYLVARPDLRWVTINTLLVECCKVKMGFRQISHNGEVAKILHELGWREKRVTMDGVLTEDEEDESGGPPLRGGRREKRVRVWVPPPDFWRSAPKTDTLDGSSAAGAPETDDTSAADESVDKPDNGSSGADETGITT